MHAIQKFTLLLCTALTCSVFAQNSYPSKTITLVTPQPGGSGTNLVARVIGERLTQRWNQSVIVEEKLGAQGAIAAEYVARARADGYTLLVGSAGQMTIAPLMTKLSYSPEQFVPLAHLGSLPNVLVVNAKSKVNNVKDLVDKAKNTPAGLNYGSLGTGSIGQATVDALMKTSGIKAESIYYKSEPQAIVELLGGQVDFVVAALPVVLPHVKAGTLIALGVTSKNRSALLPQVAPLSEQGFPEIEIAQWYGLYGPSGMNKDVAEKITTALRAIYLDPAIPTKLAEFSMEAPSAAEQDFPKFVNSERTRWQRLVKPSVSR